MCTFVVT